VPPAPGQGKPSRSSSSVDWRQLRAAPFANVAGPRSTIWQQLREHVASEEPGYELHAVELVFARQQLSEREERALRERRQQGQQGGQQACSLTEEEEEEESSSGLRSGGSSGGRRRGESPAARGARAELLQERRLPLLLLSWP
jgi:hypothetical protein